MQPKSSKAASGVCVPTDGHSQALSPVRHWPSSKDYAVSSGRGWGGGGLSWARGWGTCQRDVRRASVAAGLFVASSGTVAVPGSLNRAVGVSDLLCAFGPPEKWRMASVFTFFLGGGVRSCIFTCWRVDTWWPRTPCVACVASSVRRSPPNRHERRDVKPVGASGGVDDMWAEECVHEQWYRT